MSTDAIAAVTTTLMNLLGSAVNDVGGAIVTAFPLDKAADGLQEGQGRINLFLYQTSVNAAWSNMDPPHQTKPGERGYPPLPLNLYYLLTPYTGDQNGTLSQRLLGRAMSILYDNAILSHEFIVQIPPQVTLQHQQIESVRLTLQPLSLDEMSKLWNMFQTQYRTSVAYQAAVVLIESTRLRKTPLPVLRRGPEDEGVTTDLMPLPALDRLELPARQPSLRLGDTLTIHGSRMDGDSIRVRLRHPALPDPLTVEPLPGATPDKLKIEFPAEDAAVYPAGFYTLAVVVSQTPRADRPVEQGTNELPFALAPWVTIPKEPITLATVPDERAILTLESVPDVWPKQRVSVLLGSFDSPADPHPDKGNRLTFDVSHIPAGRYLVRLRIDGVDSLPIDNFEDRTKPLAFAESQKITLPPQIIVPANPVRTDPDSGTEILSLVCRPDVWPDQKAVLLIADQEIEAKARLKKTDTLTFNITGIPPGEYPITLRIGELSDIPAKRHTVVIP